MGARFKVTLDMQKLQTLAANFGGNLDSAVEAVADQAVAYVQTEIVTKDIIDTGALLNSIHVEPKVENMQRTVADGVEYGVYQEFGHLTRMGKSKDWVGPQNFVPARPFMLPGVLRAMDGFAEQVSEWCFTVDPIPPGGVLE